MDRLIRLTAIKTMMDLFLTDALAREKELSGEWQSDDHPENGSLGELAIEDQENTDLTRKTLLKSYLSAAFESNPLLYFEFKALISEFTEPDSDNKE